MAVTEIQFTSHVFKEGSMYVAYTPELDLSSCARTEAKASKNLQEAVRLFLEEAEKHGTLHQILEEAGFEPAVPYSDQLSRSLRRHRRVCTRRPQLRTPLHRFKVS